MTVFLVPALICFGAAALLVAAELSAPRRQLRASLGRAAAYGQRAPDVGVHRRRALLLDAERVGALVLRFSPKSALEAAERRLDSAGLRYRLSPSAYLALRLGAGLGGFLLGVVLGALVGGAGIALLVGCGLGLSGFLALPALLNARARERAEALQKALPNALDLLAVSAEAGLSLDGAIAKLVDATKGPLAEEFRRALAEVRAGESRQEALRRLAERVDAPELGAFVRAAGRANNLGVSVAATLRAQAADARMRRQTAAEERAAKAPVKILFPTIFCLFPALFVIVLGPALIQLGRVF